MYIPPYYKQTDHHKLVDFMKVFNFASLISSANDEIHATHLPFAIEQRGDKIYLVSHLAKANPQWNEFIEKELLVIFQGPHGYVSPTHYEKQQNVPTWNYIAVHAYGKAVIIDEHSEVVALMEKTITSFEPAFIQQWNTLSTDYKNSMLKSIVAFEIEVTRLEGKFKLSQNKTVQEQEKIANHFESSANNNEQSIGKAMKEGL
jgi:transcriptional regulator